MGWMCSCCYLDAIFLSLGNEMQTKLPAISGRAKLMNRGKQVNFLNKSTFQAT